ncbi:MAG: hypothetical protein ACRC37_02945, partial [Lentisphaeria bacterium]
DLKANANNLISRSFFPGKISRSLSMTFKDCLPPDVVEASTDKTRKITVTWNYTEEPSNFNDFGYEIWRGTSRVFDDATLIGKVEPLDDMFEDTNVEVSPKVYYYWVKAVDFITNQVSGPSRSVQGMRLATNNNFIPVVDNTSDKDLSFFDSTTGSVMAVTRSDDGTRDEEDIMIRMAANNSGATRNNGDMNLTASVVKYVDFSEHTDSKIVMHFDYKFEDNSKGGFMRVLAGGKVLYSKNAFECTDNWVSTGDIDLSIFAGNQRVKIEIQMTCDVLYPTQALWFDNLYIGAQRILPSWELISSPRANTTLKDLLNVPFSYNDTLFGWDKSIDDYSNHSDLEKYILEPTAGYWFFAGESLKPGDINIGTKEERTLKPINSMLNKISRGWNIAGPVEDTILRDKSQVTIIDNDAHYLNDYPNIADYIDSISYDELGNQIIKPILTPNCTFWKWSTEDEYYIEESDKLESGRAYWIFKY